jgi:hypothetical protein
MNYQEAKKIREKSYISYLTEKLSEGQGVGSAIKATLSDKSKARSKGFSEKFDVLKFKNGSSETKASMAFDLINKKIIESNILQSASPDPMKRKE